MKKLLLVTFLPLLLCLNGYSQTLSINDTLAAFNIPDTVSYGSTSSYTIPVEYLGGNFNGTVYLVAGVDSSGGLQSIDTVASQVVSFIGPDSIFFNVLDSFVNSNGYRFFGNVVVIWPVAAGINTLDTFQTDVFVTSSVGINENQDLYNSFSVYPNPTKDYIYIDKKDQNIDVGRVRIYNLRGRLIYDEKFRSKINISHLQRGLYFLKLEIEGGKELNYKLIKD
ncbi:MAG: T9SS type A sorting domain-containing protein [Flavobacteriales bacterium]|nr:T9SS type A sorting domain-containing protein [Flavobacteriales bacterium]